MNYYKCKLNKILSTGLNPMRNVLIDNAAQRLQQRPVVL